jgi:cytochrome c553
MFEVVDRDDMIVQTMAAFTSTTAGCARCHDHKFDPISQKTTTRLLRCSPA